jgi:hypothetical protein
MTTNLVGLGLHLYPEPDPERSGSRACVLAVVLSAGTAAAPYLLSHFNRHSFTHRIFLFPTRVDASVAVL